MKLGKLAVLIAAVVGGSQVSHGAVFISEYIEGSSFNKSIELYNSGSSAVNLLNYKLELYSNGATTASQTLTFVSTSLAAADVYVISHGQANATILAATDLTNSSVINFNGDDAVVLKDNTGAIIDVFGDVGNDPGSNWGSGATSTVDHTLRRKSSILTGDTNATDNFDPSIEWDGFAVDTASGLGSHTVDSGPIDPPPGVPEPTSLGLLSLGGLAALRRRRA